MGSGPERHGIVPPVENVLTITESERMNKSTLMLMASMAMVPMVMRVAGADGAAGGDVIERHDGKAAEMAKPVQVFILLGQSNMVGLGKIKGPDGSLEFAVREKGKYPYLVDEAKQWVARKDVRYVQFMQRKGMLKNDWLTVAGNTMGPEYGIGHVVGNAVEAPVMVL